MKRKIVKVSAGACWFCGWKPTKEKGHDIRMANGVVYVFCPECGYEIPDALFLIGENVDK